MKTIIFISTIVATLVIMGCNDKKTEKSSVQDSKSNFVEYQIDVEKSYIHWTGSIVGVYSHYGTLKFKTGIVQIEDKKVVGGSFVVDMNTISPTDENYKMAPKERLVEHLVSDDFFNVSQFPESSLKITGFDKNFLNASLTVRGITNDEKITDLKIEKTENGIMLYGKMIFDRQKYKVSYKSKMKDKVLSDNIEIEVYLFTN